MNNKDLYVYLGKCIQKIRYEQYNQDELADGICSKYTLSRIENGKIPRDINIVIKLMERLGYHYKDVVDLAILHSLINHIIAQIEYYNIDEIISDINKMNDIITRNKNNILFLDHKILYHYLHSHYIDKIAFTVHEYDLNTLHFHSNSFYTLLVSVISENLLLYQDIHKFIDFFDSLSKKSGNIIIDFFHMLYLQYNGQSLLVNDIFNYHKEELYKDMKTYQLIRYRSVLAIGFIEYEPDKAIRHFDKITSVHKKCNQINNYYFITVLGKIVLYIKEKKLHEAYECIDNCIHEYPQLVHYAIPYIIFLSFRIDKQVDNIYLTYGYNEICDACIAYYQFRSSDITGTEHIRFLSKKFIKLANLYGMNDPFITLLKKEELYQVDRGHCYCSGAKFFKKLQANCKEVIPL